jgi:hypothetical protein
MSKTINMVDTLGHKSVMEKQRAAIEKLRQQNEQLKHDLLLENKFSVRPGDPYAQALINRLQDEGDMLARKLVLEMRKSKLLDLHISETNNVLGTTRSLMGGIYAAKEKVQAAQMQIKLLENRLEKSYVKYNQSSTHNKQLRDQINNLRRERLMFESINSNLEKELQKLKKEMAETIQLANAAFEAKEKAISEMNVLKVQADKEQQGFEEEWRHLSAMIEEDKRERERARAKELAMRERETQELLKMGTAGMDKKKTKSFGKSLLHSKSMEQNVAAEKVQMYTQAFEKIQQATGIEDIDQLVHTFITAEDQNYTLFNYVNEVNTEIEKLEDQITAIKIETEKYKSSGQEFDKSKGAQFADAEGSLLLAESQADLYQRKFDAACSTISRLKTSIGDIFTKIGCDTPAVRELLGDEGVTDHNIMSYLGIIEQRTNELLHINAARKAGEVSESAMEALLAQPLTLLSSRVVIEPPSTTQEEEIEGMEPEIMDDDRPLTRDMLEIRVNKTLPYKIDTAIKVRPPGAETTSKRTHARR